MKISVLGRQWEVRAIDEDLMAKLAQEDGLPADSEALCDKAERKLYYPYKATPVALRHELFHAHVSECCIQSAGLTWQQMEEVCADVFGEYGESMCAQAKQILKRLKK